MIQLKKAADVETMRQGGKRLRLVLEKVLKGVQPGVTKASLEEIAETEIQKQGGKPSFKMVPGYRWATCITINDEVVHGIPNDRIIEDGDIVGVDVGIYFKGFNTDLATTVVAGKNVNSETKRFLKIGEAALGAAIDKVRPGNFVGDISQTIQERIEVAGFSPVKVLTGHGVGRKLHEPPSIPNFLRGERRETPKLKEGMVLAIEVIYNLGSEKVVLEDDGWTISTQDGKISGLFEETVAVIKDGPLILTR
ncbi:MAG: type I methionyl aminopeptidase [bacterium]|nr:type I methionyl aminopeptidase [bacterium]